MKLILRLLEEVSRLKKEKKIFVVGLIVKKNNLVIFTSAKYMDLSFSINSTKILCWNSNEQYRINKVYKSKLVDKKHEDRKYMM